MNIDNVRQTHREYEYSEDKQIWYDLYMYVLLTRLCMYEELTVCVSYRGS